MKTVLSESIREINRKLELIEAILLLPEEEISKKELVEIKRIRKEMLQGKSMKLSDYLRR